MGTILASARTLWISDSEDTLDTEYRSGAMLRDISGVHSKQLVNLFANTDRMTISKATLE